MLLISGLLVSLMSIPALCAPQAGPMTTSAVTSTVTSTAVATPAPTSTSDNGACAALVADCTGKESPSFLTVFNKLSCVAAVACLNPTQNIDASIKSMYNSTHNDSSAAPTSRDQQPFSTNIFNQHSSDGKVWTQQNWIDTYYGALSALPKPVFPPTADFAISYWDAIVAWAGFCSTNAVPYQNLADWFHWSSISAGPNTTCVASASTTTVPPSTTSTSTSTAPTTTSTGISSGQADGGACDALIAQCTTKEDPVFETFFNELTCISALACLSPKQSIDASIRAIYTQRNSIPDSSPTSANQSAFSRETFNSHSTDGQTWTQQNWIDTYYGALNSLPSPVFPPSPSFAISYWNVIVAWTGFCGSRTVPYQNLSDWFRWSSSVVGATASC